MSDEENPFEAGGTNPFGDSSASGDGGDDGEASGSGSGSAAVSGSGSGSGGGAGSGSGSGGEAEASGSGSGGGDGDGGEDDGDDDIVVEDAGVGTSTGGGRSSAAHGNVDDEGLPTSSIHADYFEIEVSSPQKVGSGLSSHTSYTILTRTTLDKFGSPEFNVQRRYTDFVWLRDVLGEVYPASIVPPLPEKNATSRFDEDFVATRRRELEHFLRRIASHELLHDTPEFQLFLESQSDLPWKQKSKGSSFMKFVSSVGQTVTNYVMAPDDEPDPWFAKKTRQLHRWGTQLEELAFITEGLVKSRKGMGEAALEFATGAKAVGQSETDPKLANAMNSMGKVSERVAEIYTDQAMTDIALLLERMREYLRYIDSAKAALDRRTQAFGDWVSAKNTLAKKTANYEKLNATPGKASKANKARGEMEAAADAAEAAEEHFAVLSKALKKEIRRFNKNKVLDFKNALLDAVDALIAGEDELIGCWEGLMPEVRDIGAAS